MKNMLPTDSRTSIEHFETVRGGDSFGTGEGAAGELEGAVETVGRKKGKKGNGFEWHLLNS